MALAIHLKKCHPFERPWLFIQKRLSSVRMAQAICSEAQNAIRQKNWSTILMNDFAKKQLSR